MNLSALHHDSIQPAAGAIDFSKQFMPAHLTPLFHTRIYAELTDFQRRRYNQLHALYFNEQTMYFEKALANNTLGCLLKKSIPDKLKAGLREFISEEERHSVMFLHLNRRCAPEIYSRQDFHFIRLPATGVKMIDFIASRPFWFPLILWLMHLQEERALYFARSFLQSDEELEPHFISVQRQHATDEAGHVRWDEELLDWVWPKTNYLVRWLNARFLSWMIGEYFSAPKRAALHVVAALLDEFPDLEPRRQEIRRQLLALEHDHSYRSSLYNEMNVPNTFKRFDCWPEFRSLGRVMPGYAAGRLLA